MKANPEDRALVLRFADGDAAAFDEIVTRYRRELYQIARRMLGSHADADDAVQEAWVRAFKGLGRFRGEARLRTWLIQILLNVCRSQRGRRRLVVEASDVDPVDPRIGAEEAARRRELRREIRRRVSQLPPRQREVVLLKVFSGLTYRDVAAAMSLSEGAVKAHLHQAVANLRRRMAEG